MHRVFMLLLLGSIMTLPWTWANPISAEEAADPMQLYGGETGPFEVATQPTVKLRDADRDKELLVRVTYPKQSESKSPCPVILWSHGMFGSKDGYQPLVRYWASHGYIVIQPTHEDSLALGNTTFGDFASGSKYWKTRPEDVVFLLNSLDTIAEQVKGLPGMDKSKLAMGGHSFGAHTTMLLSGVQAKSALRPLREEYDSFLEDRFVCTLMISPQGPGPMFTEKSYQGFAKPSLMITGTLDEDPIQHRPYTWRTKAFDLIPASNDGTNRMLAILDGARHDFGGISGARYQGSGPRKPEQVALVRSLSLAFFDLHLKPTQHEKARVFLSTQGLAAVAPGGVTFQQK